MKIGTLHICWRAAERVGVRTRGREIGISHSTLSRIENGEAPSGKTLNRRALCSPPFPEVVEHALRLRIPDLEQLSKNQGDNAQDAIDQLLWKQIEFTLAKRKRQEQKPCLTDAGLN